MRPGRSSRCPWWAIDGDRVPASLWVRVWVRGSSRRLLMQRALHCSWHQNGGTSRTQQEPRKRNRVAAAAVAWRWCAHFCMCCSSHRNSMVWLAASPCACRVRAGPAARWRWALQRGRLQAGLSTHLVAVVVLRPRHGLQCLFQVVPGAHLYHTQRAHAHLLPQATSAIQNNPLAAHQDRIVSRTLQ
jgi:hypothetical protein